MSKTLEKKKIIVLVVDDDSDLLNSVRDCLKFHGDFDVETALSCAEAFEKMEKKMPDVIVSDLQMPVTNGFEFLKMLRDKGNDIPFIVFTMNDKKEVALQAFHLGANGFIKKFGDPSLVFSQLKKCIESVTGLR
jgi:CheY-like chemotaxis protein